MTHSAEIRRRSFLQAGASVCAGVGVLGMLRRAFAAHEPASGRTAKRCVVLWMNGGPSQLETFDPKSGPNGGPTGDIATSVSGVRISANLPKLAKRMNQLAVLRNVTSPEGEHERAQYYLHTGFRMVPAFPRPALGSVVSHQRPRGDAPQYVLLGQRAPGPAYCGPEHSAFAIQSAERATELLSRVRRRKDELNFLQELNQPFDSRNRFPAVERRRSVISRIERLVDSPFREALNLDSESDTTRERYGKSEFGRRCLLARRLLERETSFVEVQLDGWDTHVNNFDSVTRLAQPLDSAADALLDDLQASGLLKDTLVVWMGDFGRTPVINGQNGRDHFPRVTPVVLAGGGVSGGQVIGGTDPAGAQIVGDAYEVPDLAATLLHKLGVDLETEFRTAFDSPTKPVEMGASLIKELL